MECKRTVDGGKVVISLSGRFDTLAASRFSSTVDELISENRDLVLDLNDVEYITSAGIESVLRLYRALGDRLEFRNVKGLVREEFETVRYILEE